MARGKNLGDMFFDVFQQALQESEVKSQKKWLFAKISDLLSLFVRDCITYQIHGIVHRIHGQTLILS